MAAQKGLELLLKIDISSTYTTIGGIRNARVSLNDGSTVDVTSIDDTDRMRQLLAGAGVRSISISGDGVFKDDAAIEALRTEWAAGTHPSMQAILPDWGTIEGPFQITSLEVSGAHDGEVTFSVSLESAGDWTWTAAGA